MTQEFVAILILRGYNSHEMDTGSFPVVKSGRVVTLTPHFLLVPLVMKE
jgi:hypothetical protein